VAVGEEQHYGRAASTLRVAQPALSRQILDLEEELGFKLFERLPRGVKLSAAGSLFLEDARRSRNRYHLTRGRFGHASGAGSRVAKGQYLSSARKLHWRGNSACQKCERSLKVEAQRVLP
jgi:DNA-binding transcriptional LysR family regulator